MARRRKVRSVDYGTYKSINVYRNLLVIDSRQYKSDIETYEYFKRIKREEKNIKLFCSVKNGRILGPTIKIY